MLARIEERTGSIATDFKADLPVPFDCDVYCVPCGPGEGDPGGKPEDEGGGDDPDHQESHQHGGTSATTAV